MILIIAPRKISKSVQLLSIVSLLGLLSALCLYGCGRQETTITKEPTAIPTIEVLKATSTNTPAATQTVIPTALQATQFVQPTISPPNNSQIAAAIIVNNNLVVFTNNQFEEVSRINASYLYLDTIVSGEKCSLIGLIQEKPEIIIGFMDLKNNKITEEKLAKWDPTLTNYFRFSLSPNGREIAFLIPSGKEGRGQEDAQFLDVGIIHTNNGVMTWKQISRNGGSSKRGAQWSPNGKYLAYTDRDNNNVAQAYLYNSDEKSIQQITSFLPTDTNLKIDTLSWSASGWELAFAVNNDERGLAYISLNNLANINWLNIGDTYFQVHTIWWIGKDKLLLGITNNHNGKNFLQVHNTSSRQLLFQLPNPLSNKADIYGILPLDYSDRITIVGTINGNHGYWLTSQELTEPIQMNNVELLEKYKKIIAIPASCIVN